MERNLPESPINPRMLPEVIERDVRVVPTAFLGSVRSASGWSNCQMLWMRR